MDIFSCRFGDPSQITPCKLTYQFQPQCSKNLPPTTNLIPTYRISKKRFKFFVPITAIQTIKKRQHRVWFGNIREQLYKYKDQKNSHSDFVPKTTCNITIRVLKSFASIILKQSTRKNILRTLTSSQKWPQILLNGLFRLSILQQSASCNATPAKIQLFSRKLSFCMMHGVVTVCGRASYNHLLGCNEFDKNKLSSRIFKLYIPSPMQTFTKRSNHT